MRICSSGCRGFHCLKLYRVTYCMIRHWMMKQKKQMNHLLKLDPHENLFVRVPRLPLPKALQSYLLYDQTLDDEAEETDESSAEAGSA